MIAPPDVTVKYYLDLLSETFEVSEATAKELMAKGVESLEVFEEPGYFWKSIILKPKLL